MAIRKPQKASIRRRPPPGWKCPKHSGKLDIVSKIGVALATQSSFSHPQGRERTTVEHSRQDIGHIVGCGKKDVDERAVGVQNLHR